MINKKQYKIIKKRLLNQKLTIDEQKVFNTLPLKDVLEGNLNPKSINVNELIYLVNSYKRYQQQFYFNVIATIFVIISAITSIISLFLQ